MNRRHFISLWLGTMAAGNASALPFEPSYAARLGDEILRQKLLPADALSLRTDLGVADMPLGEILARRWQKEIRDDFSAARTLNLSGWMLSKTEANICAVASLERT